MLNLRRKRSLRDCRNACGIAVTFSINAVEQIANLFPKNMHSVMILISRKRKQVGRNMLRGCVKQIHECAGSFLALMLQNFSKNLALCYSKRCNSNMGCMSSAKRLRARKQGCARRKDIINQKQALARQILRGAKRASDILLALMSI